MRKASVSETPPVPRPGSGSPTALSSQNPVPFVLGGRTSEYLKKVPEESCPRVPGEGTLSALSLPLSQSWAKFPTILRVPEVYLVLSQVFSGDFWREQSLGPGKRGQETWTRLEYSGGVRPTAHCGTASGAGGSWKEHGVRMHAGRGRGRGGVLGVLGSHQNE